jgi:hypothetical protein
VLQKNAASRLSVCARLVICSRPFVQKFCSANLRDTFGAFLGEWSFTEKKCHAINSLTVLSDIFSALNS